VRADLCFGFSVEDCRKLDSRLDHDESAWAEAIRVFERRMKERFFTCIDALIKADTKPDSPSSASSASSLRRTDAHCIPGFSIMALCCLLIETMQAFREGPSADTAGQFTKFLKRPAFGGAFADDKIAECFVKGIRNGILHEAETRKWIIRRNRPAGQMVAAEQDGYILNRCPFYEAVKQEFEGYLMELRDPSNRDSRKRFREQMNQICKKA
jgi:hypothetical protein